MTTEGSMTTEEGSKSSITRSRQKELELHIQQIMDILSEESADAMVLFCLPVGGQTDTVRSGSLMHGPSRLALGMGIQVADMIRNGSVSSKRLMDGMKQPSDQSEVRPLTRETARLYAEGKL